LTANVFDPIWDADVDRPPYRWRRSRIGRRARCELLGASLFEVQPGASTLPLHAHYANEELIVVITGRLVLRSIDGERELTPGDVVSCPRGRRGAHRLRNAGSDAARILIVSTMNSPDVNEFPDSGLLWARTHAPGDEPGLNSLEVAGGPGGLDPLSLP